MWKPEFRPAVVEPGEGIWPPGLRLHLHRLVTTYSHYMDVWQTCTQYYSTSSRVCNLLKNLSLIEENNTQITGSEELLSGRCILVNTFKNSPLDKDTKTSGVTLITSFGKWNETRRKTQNGDTWWTACPSPHTNNRTRQEFFFTLLLKPLSCMERPWELSCSTELTAAMYHMSSRVSVLSVPRVLCHMFCILCTKRIVGGAAVEA